MLALLDFPELIADRYKVHHLEACAAHFPSTELAYLREFKYMLVHTRSTIVNLPVNIMECGSDGTFSDPDREQRMAALDAVKQWVDVAHTVGVRSVGVGPGKVDADNLERTAESYKALATYAQAKGVRVMVENGGAFGTENPEEWLTLLKLTAPRDVGALLDFAKIPDESARGTGLKSLFPYAQTVCRVGSLESGTGGTETRHSFAEVMEIAENAHFRGVYSIEFDGPGDPYAGIQKILDELLEYL